MSKSATRCSLVVLCIAVGPCLAPVSFASAQTPWVLIARKASQRVQHMRVDAEKANEPTHDFASVLLEAPADKVFTTALTPVRKNQQVRLLMNDPASRRLQFARGDRVATMTVVDLAPEVSQLMIAGTAAPNEAPIGSEVVAAVLRVCREMGKACQVDP